MSFTDSLTVPVTASATLAMNVQFNMHRDKSVNKTCLLQKFLNDINKIDYTKHGTKSRHGLKCDKPKSFALPMRPQHFNKKFHMQLDGGSRSNAQRSVSAAMYYPESKIFEPEVNIFVNRSIQNCVSFTNVHKSTPLNPVVNNDREETKINFRDVFSSTHIDEQQDLLGKRSNESRYTYKQFEPLVLDESSEVVRRKTIYDYAAETTLADITDEEKYANLKKHLNTNILEKLDPNIFQTANRSQQLLERINHYRKLDIINRSVPNETNVQFRTPRYNVSTTPSVLNETPSLLNESPLIQSCTMFERKEKLTFFDFESFRKEEFLWIKPKPIRKKQTTSQKNPMGDTTFFEKPDIDREFLKLFSMQ